MARSRKNNFIAALDIGSSKVACFIAHKEAGNKVKVVGIGHQISKGITGGTITDITAANNSILSAVGAAEQMAGQRIDKVVVNISGNNLRSQNLHVEAPIGGREISESDMSYILAQSLTGYSNEDRELIHCIPTNYTIDGSSGIKNPRGMYADNLSIDLHLASVSNSYLHNLSNCLADCHIDISDWVVSPYASGIACLTEDEKNLGTVLVDIGGGTTSLAVFLSGNLIHSEMIPIGGLHITKDLARGLGTNLNYAERIKTLYGSAIKSGSSDEVIDLQIYDSQEGSSDAEQEIDHVSKREIVEIINPRVEEILEIMRNNLQERGFDKLAGNRVVLTGGTSQLAGIKELATKVFSKHVRLGRPFTIDGLAESTRGPAFSTCVGMLQYVTQGYDRMIPQNVSEKTKRSRGVISKFIHWIEDNF